ncbi:hypothetical protein N7524_000545 [Penicillium chrysogenum]|nr:hypothetical protein N7524_000545 [Penicillium chrysogenum]
MGSQLTYKTRKIIPIAIAVFLGGIRDGDFDHISNTTLGFEHIYAIGLKERTDKRDFLTVSASVTGFEVDWVDGVHSQELQQKALPNGYNLSTIQPNAVGCWRAHMNVLNSVIANSYSSALVLEDDADWDVNIKTQLREFARGLHSLKGDKRYPNRLLTELIGIFSGLEGVRQGQIKMKLNSTPFLKIQQSQVSNVDTHGLALWIAGKRCFLKTRHGSFTALKKAAALMEAPVDLAMSELCGGTGDRERIECFAPFPNLIGTYRPAGPAFKDSDINSGDQTVHEEQAYNLVYSTRRNIHRLVSGAETVLSQWGEESPWSPGEVNPKGLVYPRGYHFH